MVDVVKCFRIVGKEMLSAAIVTSNCSERSPGSEREIEGEKR